MEITKPWFRFGGVSYFSSGKGMIYTNQIQPVHQMTGGNIGVEEFLGNLSLHFALTQPRATTPATDFVPQLLDDARRGVAIHGRSG